MTAYYKITNQEETHNGFQYQDGLNVVNEEFDDRGASAIGIAYFTDINHVPLFYGRGINIRKVTLPDTDSDFEMVATEDGKFRVNRIILGEKMSLFDPKTYQDLGLNMQDNNYLVYFACKYKNFDFLNWWLTSGLELYYAYYIIDHASKNGDFDILNWWLKSGLKLEFSADSMIFAAANGRADVLDWWIESGLRWKCLPSAVDEASTNGHVNVLEWFKKNMCVPGYTGAAFNGAFENNHIAVLDWWLNSGLKIKYSYKFIESILDKCEPETIEWFRKNEARFPKNYNNMIWKDGQLLIDDVDAWNARQRYLYGSVSYVSPVGLMWPN